MVNRIRPNRRRTAGAVALAGVGGLVLVLASGVLLPRSAPVGARKPTRPAAVTPRVARPLTAAPLSAAPLTAAPLTVAAQSVLGLDVERSLAAAYLEPPPDPDPFQPATMITLGVDDPDPFMVDQDGLSYLFTSQAEQTEHVPVVVGARIGYWKPVIDAMPQEPAWAVPGDTRAPDMHRFGNHYVLYFSQAVQGTSPALRCIGDAVASRITGPYVPAPTPFICQLALGGSIDPRTFVDGNGTPYMIWKSDENSDINGTSLTNIFSQPLSPDGEQLLGQPTRIFGPDEAWQGRIVEAPDLVEMGGIYYLFYSGNWFNQNGYAIGVARCAGPLGPCADTSATPFLGSNAQGDGPGEASVFRDASGIWLLYTPFRSDLPNFTSPRPVAMARLGFGPEGPYLGLPPVLASGSSPGDA